MTAEPDSAASAGSEAGGVPFSGSIIGSWLFTRSTSPKFRPRGIYHFTASGKCIWEVDNDRDEKRLFASCPCCLSGDTFTLTYSGGEECDFPMVVEEDASVRIMAADNESWWMIRLTSPEPYSRAFVDEHGEFKKMERTE